MYIGVIISSFIIVIFTTYINGVGNVSVLMVILTVLNVLLVSLSLLLLMELSLALLLSS